MGHRGFGGKNPVFFSAVNWKCILGTEGLQADSGVTGGGKVLGQPSRVTSLFYNRLFRTRACAPHWFLLLGPLRAAE
jgi:hypothetical protein